MKFIGFPAFFLSLALALLLVFEPSNRAGVNEEQVWLHRNLGKAFYENPTTQAQAVGEFRKALELAPDSARERLNYGLSLLRAGQTAEGIAELEKVQRQDPSLPHTWFNLSIAFKKARQYAKAEQQLKGFLKLVPDDPIAHYNLGIVYKFTDRVPMALQEFGTAARLNPDLAAPRFQTYNIYREAEKEKEADQALQVFKDIKARQIDPDASEDMEWNYYAELYDPIDPADSVQAVPGALKFEDRVLEGKFDAVSSGLAVLDFDNDGHSDLLAWSSTGIRLYRKGTELVAASGLEGIQGVVSVAAGDYDNDGLVDLCVIASSGAALYHNEGGNFRKSSVSLPAGKYAHAVWLDYDHDFDLDLLLFGEDNRLLRNQGLAGFEDHSGNFPFAKGTPAGSTVLHLISDYKGMDLVVSYENRKGVLYRDKLLGQYEAVTIDDLPEGATALAQVDFDNDGWMDIAYAREGRIGLVQNRDGKLSAFPADLKTTGGLLFADFERRAISDLVAGGAVYRNQGKGKFVSQSPAGLVKGQVWASADFDGDGNVDLAGVSEDGALHLLLNKTPGKNHWVSVRLTGVKNLKLPFGTEVEVKTGSLYQKQMYEAAPLVFGLRSHPRLESLRITWPNGMVQNVTEQGIDRRVDIKEAPRLSGSCPMIFTWNGKQFQFLTDVLGVAPLGASSGDGKYFPVDHDEYVQIPGEAMVARDGRFEIRITEELSEVSYLDQVRLIAVDHPSEVEIYSNDKWKSPPFPAFRLFGVRRRVYPKEARDGRGRDVLRQVLSRDRVYVDGFRRDYAGVAETHSLDLDFGAGTAPEGKAVLVLNGWVDWADGSTFLAQAQEGRGGLVPPYLQVKDASGNWRTVIDDLGIPSGKTKTIAVDLSGKFLSASREVRIVTNLCVYWDEVFLGEDTVAPPARLTPVDARTADLEFRGFSQVTIHPERKQPEYFDYSRVSTLSSWNPTPGMYTRYGAVEELVREADDRLVIMGSGDELRLSFDASRLPALQNGWRRDFLLLVDGWAKDRDANTAYSQTVEPLPFHGMSSYPYPENETFPRDNSHEEYLKTYIRRPALRLLRPLTAQR